MGCLYCRIGWLYLFNPCKPEGSYELDFSRREVVHYEVNIFFFVCLTHLVFLQERIVAKMLCALATLEPGDNWLEKEFKWSRSMEPMPGLHFIFI